MHQTEMQHIPGNGLTKPGQIRNEAPPRSARALGLSAMLGFSGQVPLSRIMALGARAPAWQAGWDTATLPADFTWL